MNDEVEFWEMVASQIQYEPLLGEEIKVVNKFDFGVLVGQAAEILCCLACKSAAATAQHSRIFVYLFH